MMYNEIVDFFGRWFMDFSVAAVFSDYCVLQRGRNICIFGDRGRISEKTGGLKIGVRLTAKDGTILGENYAYAGENRWEVWLEPQKAQEGCSLKIWQCDSEEAVTFSDVSIGEVWLAGGQSNMEFELQNCTEGPGELEDSTGKNGANKVRFYYTNKIAWQAEAFFEAERNTCWQTWESDGKKAWSAVGFFFAKKLAAELGCTVGVIGCNWGGTSASAWMRREYLEKDVELNSYLTEQEEAVRGKSIEQQCAEYEAYEKENAIWQEKYGKLWQEDHNITWEAAAAKIGPCPWPGPRSCKNPFRPTGLYTCMLERIIPYTIKGVIWYQGESDDHKPGMYAKLFSNMIENWRRDWNDTELPFVFVQLPVHRYEADKDFKHWCLIRQAQEKVFRTVKNTYMACGFELGQFSDIHPKAKKVIGERLEQLAAAGIYKNGDLQTVTSPMLKDSIALNGSGDENGCMQLYFENCPDGFVVRQDEKRLEEYKKMEANQGNSVPEDFTGFEIAGDDKVFYPAEYAFCGTDGKQNCIRLFSKKVKNPVFARYGWFNYGPVTVFGKNGLPLAPFSTLD